MLRMCDSYLYTVVAFLELLVVKENEKVSGSQYSKVDLILIVLGSVGYSIVACKIF